MRPFAVGFAAMMWLSGLASAATARDIAPCVNGLCERTSIAALMKRSGGAKGTWKVLEADHATAVGITRDDSAACDDLPAAAFFVASDKVKLGDLRMLIDAVEQIRPCARQSDACNTRITATPWSLLDDLAATRTPSVVSYVDRDPNRSSGNLLWYRVDFSIDDSRRRYGADIRVTDGRVQVVDLVEVVPDLDVLHSADVRPTATPDGRFGTRCYTWGADTSQDLCRVSFYRLIAAPERHHNKNVAVTGYLVKVYGYPVLFPNEASFRGSAFSEGIALLDGSLPAEIERNLENGVFPVIVVGTFDAKHVGHALPLLGAFTSVHNVTRYFPQPAASEIASRNKTTRTKERRSE